MFKIFCDIDGVLANFTEAYAEAMIEVQGSDPMPAGWRTNPDFPPKWSWEREAGFTETTEAEAWTEHILKPTTFWKGLQPLPGAPEALAQLNRLWKAGHEVTFLTHRMGTKAKRQTEEWLHKHGMDLPCVLMAADKAPLLALLRADFFVDDKPQTIAEVARANITGLTTYLKTAPYNRECRYPGIRLAASLKDALVDFGIWEEPKRRK